MTLLRNLLVTSLAGSLPAHAIVLQARPTPAEDALLRARSHEAAAKHTSVVGIFIQNWADEVDVGTGVFLGTRDDGRTGLVLSSAHAFTGDPRRKDSEPAVVLLNFGTAINDAALAVRARVLKVHFHPRLANYRDASGRDPEGKALEAGMTRHDLALLEFEMAPVQRELEARKVAPAILYAGTGFDKKPLLTAEIAGFGMTGTTAGPTLVHTFQIHGGHTLVTYGTCTGRTGFWHVSRCTPAGMRAFEDKNPRANRWQVALTPEATTAIHPTTHVVYPVKSTPNQALIAEGDSGGPLFFMTKEGYRLAGIAAHGQAEFLMTPSGRPEPHIMQVWEPLMDQQDWLRTVRAGGAGGGRVLDLSVDPRDAPGAAPVEKKAPAGPGRPGPKSPSGDSHPVEVLP